MHTLHKVKVQNSGQLCKFLQLLCCSTHNTVCVILNLVTTLTHKLILHQIRCTKHALAEYTLFPHNFFVNASNRCANYPRPLYIHSFTTMCPCISQGDRLMIRYLRLRQDSANKSEEFVQNLGYRSRKRTKKNKPSMQVVKSINMYLDNSENSGPITHLVHREIRT